MNLREIFKKMLHAIKVAVLSFFHMDMQIEEEKDENKKGVKSN